MFQVQDDGGTANGGVALDQSPNKMTVNVTSVNDAPAGNNNTIATIEDSQYTFAAVDFGFTDPNDGPADALTAVKVTTIPGAGTLTLAGVAVIAGQTVAIADISAGNLKFAPAANGNGTGYASFTFQLQDDGGTANGGVDLDATPATISINVTAVDDAPILSQNRLIVWPGASVTLSAMELNATDTDDFAPGLLFNVSAVTHGQFELVSAPAVPIMGS